MQPQIAVTSAGGFCSLVELGRNLPQSPWLTGVSSELDWYRQCAMELEVTVLLFRELLSDIYTEKKTSTVTKV